MIGHKEYQAKMYYSLSLEQLVPAKDRIRALHAALDLRFVVERVKDLYGYNGNQSVDPIVVVKLLLLGYLYDIRHIRELMRQASDRLSFRWFLGYDLDETLPDHSAISKNLSRFGPELFRELFERVLDQCRRAGLVDGKTVFIDSTTIAADASDDAIAVRNPDDAFRPDLAPRAYWEQLKKDALANTDTVNEALVSTTDPDAGIISRDGNHRELAYKDHRAVDGRCGIVLTTQATSAAITDDKQLPVVLDELLFRHGIYPETVAADRLYGRVDVYNELKERAITPVIPRSEPACRPGIFGKADFRYDSTNDCYTCPAGIRLTSSTDPESERRYYYAPKAACQACPQRSGCIAATAKVRKIERHRDEAAVEWALKNSASPTFQAVRKRRGAVIEPTFGDAKEQHAHDRARWRGLVKMQIQCYLVAVAQNLKKYVKYAGKWQKHPALAIPTIDSKANIVCPTLIFGQIRLQLA